MTEDDKLKAECYEFAMGIIGLIAVKNPAEPDHKLITKMVNIFGMANAELLMEMRSDGVDVDDLAFAMKAHIDNGLNAKLTEETLQ